MCQTEACRKISTGDSKRGSRTGVSRTDSHHLSSPKVHSPGRALPGISNNRRRRISMGRDEAELSKGEQVIGAGHRPLLKVRLQGKVPFIWDQRWQDRYRAPVSIKGLGPPCSSWILNPGLLHHSNANFLWFPFYLFRLMTCSIQGHLASHYQKEHQLDKLSERNGCGPASFRPCFSRISVWSFGKPHLEHEAVVGIWIQNRTSTGQQVHLGTHLN